ncbi:MAG: Secretory immunoglobulin A-binding protein EsiB [Verrucomicrobia subdivision 3 bacterium]|nr:Secretory immunoglobulin A-binding protein EsiB [Limisphaerales bacterium]MCS1414107.1 Secretory immunoglobulin A-binding protein EsiB [Limisphaerales bacterium]
MTDEIQRAYQTLGLEPGATLPQVKEAWRDLIQVWHPDRFPNNPNLQRKAQEQTKDLNEARDALKRYLVNGETPRQRPRPNPSTTQRQRRQAERRRQEEEQRRKQQEEVDRRRGNEEFQRRQARERRQQEQQEQEQRRKPKKANIGVVRVFLILVAVGFLLLWLGNENTVRQAAQQGDAEAQFNLGMRYLQGVGVPQDDAEAAQWHQKAAEQGHARAQFNLGWAYDNGMGVPQDDVEAVKWYRKAAHQGLAEAQFNLGRMYYFGMGVPQNDAEGYAWYLLSKARGFGYAEMLVESLEKLLTPEQRAARQTRAEVLDKQIPRQ